MTLDDHETRLREMPCMVSGGRPVSLHHVIGHSITERIGIRGTRKHSDWLQIPLTYAEHQGPQGLHSGILTWEARHGVTEAQLIDRLCSMLGVDLWALAKEDRSKERRYKRSAKILPRR